ncbi:MULTISPECIES: RES family NAD+ phosphorylase [unclassified Microbacterium]|uniref:RES family NAD+ phosphorylase n=1 Tax=unclassified Microbacterium TaxID=2609290 RepID=UPI00288334DE|nr:MULTISPECIES: RES family NAD+ phosphorylase [unclassified Microbacterium]
MVTLQDPLWRIYRSEGEHALGWNQLRHWGPAPDMRYDPHHLPTQDWPDTGVMYTALEPDTAFAEVYQEDRVITLSAGAPRLASWKPSRPLQLLNLTKNWPILNGAASAIMMDDKTHTQEWARVINDQIGNDIDGLFHSSSMLNTPMVTLFSRTERDPAFPKDPSFNRLLSDRAARRYISSAQTTTGYGVLS